MSEVALQRRRKHVEEAQKCSLREASEGGEYDLPWSQTCGDFDWLKVGCVERMCIGLERPEKPQSFDREEEGCDEPPELC